MDMRNFRLEAFQEHPRLHRKLSTCRLDHHELGVQFGVDDWIYDQRSASDVVNRDDARKDCDPVGACNEFECCDHGVHFQHGLDLDAVRLKVGIEIAAANVVRTRRNDLE